jgi:8-oxo-dGTP diphosphatase
MGMANEKDKEKQVKKKQHCYEHPRPAVTVDIILFYRGARGAEVLLIKRKSDPSKGQWALPGGFVDKDESLETAAARELEEETGLKRVRLEQVGAFGDPGRDPRGHTVSVVFAAVLNNRKKVTGADDAGEALWHPVNRPPRLAFDHKKILRVALKKILGDDAPRLGGRR